MLFRSSIKKDRRYLTKHHMEVIGKRGEIDPAFIRWKNYPRLRFPYKIRQRPGPDNALGKIKFVLPNNYSIYLHDTPSKSLFSEEHRAFSHGCIRIQEPEWLAYQLLESNAEWSRARIDSALKNEQTIQINLPSPTPVLITYFTSWIDDEGLLHFRKDIYGHDAKVFKQP